MPGKAVEILNSDDLIKEGGSQKNVQKNTIVASKSVSSWGCPTEQLEDVGQKVPEGLLSMGLKCPLKVLGSIFGLQLVVPSGDSQQTLHEA